MNINIIIRQDIIQKGNRQKEKEMLTNPKISLIEISKTERIFSQIRQKKFILNIIIISLQFH